MGVGRQRRDVAGCHPGCRVSVFDVSISSSCTPLDQEAGF
ncbi:hypothetical protein D3OALGA1CA_5772 [Olavius algarvensis associated proteobacterium Delta 3]|nr:hypothetical protein D3OALGB2SA_2402 [Olavius algarvensis associated proteobacterium Delta 3]CAB5171482.1 hypothetical protein D3OALGA1CA_5772 [Olavius algarvensis associated proteobacterium Delta 3]